MQHQEFAYAWCYGSHQTLIEGCWNTESMIYMYVRAKMINHVSLGCPWGQSEMLLHKHWKF